MGLEIARVAEIYVPEDGAYGSGYLLTSRLILTARHVVEAAMPNEPLQAPLESLPLPALQDQTARCRTRLVARPRGQFSDAVVVWSHDEYDVALIAAIDPGWRAPALSPTEWAELVGVEEVMCRAIGFPIADSDDEDGLDRDTRSLVGKIPPWSLYVKERWAIQTEFPISKVGSGKSSWAGMSGAAVFADQNMVGIVEIDPHPEDPDQLQLWALPAHKFAGESDLVAWLAADADPGVWRRSRGRRTSTSARPDASGLHVGIPKAPGEGLVGREELVQDVARNLVSGSDVALVSGLPGAGKTALAVAAARAPDVEADFPDGRLWLSVGKNAPGGLTHWTNRMASWGRKLGVSPDELAEAQTDEGGARMAALVGEAIDDRRMLLIFDDLWSPSDALIFKDIGDNCVRLTTTRFPRVANLLAQPVTPVPELDKRAATRLVEQLCPNAASDFGAKLTAVLELVGGLPLALILVGRRLQDQKLSYGKDAAGEFLSRVLIAEERLRLEVQLPASQMPLTSDPHVTLQALVELTASDLSSAQRDTLRALTAFAPKANSFSADAAAHVGGDLECVHAIRDSGLLDLIDVTNSRFAMHQTIADFARRGEGGDEDAYRRMTEYFIGFVERKAAESSSERWVDVLEPESENLRTALEWTIRAQESELGLRLMSALWPYWYERSLFQRARDLAERVLALPIPSPQEPEHLLLRAEVLNSSGNFAYNMADLGVAHDLHRQALAIRRDLDEEALTAGSLNNLGLVLRERGAYPDAITHLLQALEINERTHHSRWRLWRAMNLNNLGITADRMGAHEQARGYQQRAVEAFKEIDHAWGVDMARTDLAEVLTNLGDYDLAEDTLRDVLRDRWSAGDAKAVAAALRGVAYLRLARCDGGETVAPLLAALTLSAPIADRLGEGRALEELARAGAENSNLVLGARAVAAHSAYLDETGAVTAPWRAERLAVAVERLQAADPLAYGENFRASYDEARRGLSHLRTALGTDADGIVPEREVEGALSSGLTTATL